MSCLCDCCHWMRNENKSKQWRFRDVPIGSGHNSSPSSITLSHECQFALFNLSQIWFFLFLPFLFRMFSCLILEWTLPTNESVVNHDSVMRKGTQFPESVTRESICFAFNICCHSNLWICIHHLGLIVVNIGLNIFCLASLLSPWKWFSVFRTHLRIRDFVQKKKPFPVKKWMNFWTLFSFLFSDPNGLGKRHHRLEQEQRIVYLFVPSSSSSSLFSFSISVWIHRFAWMSLKRTKNHPQNILSMRFSSSSISSSLFFFLFFPFHLSFLAVYIWGFRRKSGFILESSIRGHEIHSVMQ